LISSSIITNGPSNVCGGGNRFTKSVTANGKENMPPAIVFIPDTFYNFKIVNLNR
jgi:hypothetical protein